MAETNQWMIDPKDAVMLLIDHQSGLFQLVKDIELPVLRNHVIALAKVSRLAKLPTFTTASVPDGPNGPLIPEIHQSNPDALYIPRTGQINAWDNPAWVEAIKGTKRKTLLIAGTLTSVCMAFPALSAVVAGGGNGGLAFNMWASAVNRDGVVCAVAFTGANRGSQWPGSRAISAQKANTANAFSLPGFALSTANLHAATQPGGSLYGLQHSNPVDTGVAYGGNSSNYGQPNDPMVGGKIVHEAKE